jgi:SAM-dependent methyltransferase
VIAAELVARTLQISPEAWQAVLSDYQATVAAPAPHESCDDEIRRCLTALAPAYRAHSPHATAAPAPDEARAACPACRAPAVEPFLVRRPAIAYGRCAACGHGLLLDAGGTPGDEAVRARYAGPDYYRARDAQGVGYDGYDREASYREAKGARIAERLRALPGSPPAALLEIGSGFGYTRAGIERAGLPTAGVDVNAHACEEARRRYGLATFHGTLREALASPASGIAAGAWDAVLYQFVLEHVIDPVAELVRARQALRPDGWLVLLLPSMEAAEIEAFGASYRSFRADHLHLFSRRSLAAVLERAGFAPHLAESFCNIHLLGDVLTPAALQHLYRSGRGPDLFVIARRSA